MSIKKPVSSVDAGKDKDLEEIKKIPTTWSKE
jgi:hypothetical protein